MRFFASLRMTDLCRLVGAGYSPDRGNVCEADKRVPVFGENPRPPEQSRILRKTNNNTPIVGACIARPPKSDETSRTDKDVRPYALRMTNFCKPVGALHEAPENGQPQGLSLRVAVLHIPTVQIGFLHVCKGIYLYAPCEQFPAGDLSVNFLGDEMHAFV